MGTSSPFCWLFVVVNVVLFSFVATDGKNRQIFVKKNYHVRRTWTGGEEKVEKVKNPPPIHIVYSADDKMKPGVEASIRSISKRASQPIHFHYIGFSPLESMPFVNFKNLTVIQEKYNLEDYMNPFSSSGEFKNKALNINAPNYARFCLDKIFPKVEKMMYLDADTVVLCDIAPLFHYTFTTTDYVLAATAREGFSGLTEKGKKYKKTKHINISFNAGVLMLHLGRWREREVSAQLKNFTLMNQKMSQESPSSAWYRLGSQPPLGLVIGEDFEDLGPTWNFQDPICIKEPGECCLYHSKGSTKPWQKAVTPKFWQNLSENELLQKDSKIEQQNFTLPLKIGAGEDFHHKQQTNFGNN